MVGAMKATVEQKFEEILKKELKGFGIDRQSSRNQIYTLSAN